MIFWNGIISSLTETILIVFGAAPHAPNFDEFEGLRNLNWGWEHSPSLGGTFPKVMGNEFWIDGEYVLD